MIAPLQPAATTAAADCDSPIGVWDYVSASRLNLWLKCPLAFRLKYIDGVRSPTTPSLFVGKQTHAALETWYRHRQLGAALAVEDLLARCSAGWPQQAAAAAVCFAHGDEEQACRQQTIELVRTYLSQIASDEPKPIAVETSVTAPLIDPHTGEDFGLPMVGILDLVLPEAAGPRIVDFKTAARGGEAVELTHELQLTSYAYLFRQSSQHCEAAVEIRSLIKTKAPKLQSQSYGARQPQHFRRLFAVIRAYLDALDHNQFVFRPNPFCASCEHLHTHCHQWCA